MVPLRPPPVSKLRHPSITNTPYFPCTPLQLVYLLPCFDITMLERESGKFMFYFLIMINLLYIIHHVGTG